MSNHFRENAVSDKNLAVRAARKFAPAIFLATAICAAGPSSAQAQQQWYHHCTTGQGARMVHYIFPPSASRAGLSCHEAFWSLQEAIGRVCYFTSLRRDMVWPQMTDPVPDFGIRIACK